MPDREKIRRTPPIPYRPPKALREELYARQLRSGLSMNGFITKSIFDAVTPGQTRRSPFEKGELARLLGNATRLHARLDEIAPVDCPDGNQSALIVAAIEDLAAIRAALLNALGRTP